MKVEEPMLAYEATPVATHLRGQIIRSVEQEKDIRVLQHLCFVMEQLQAEEHVVTPKRGLRSLRGVLKSNGKTYEEMREEYLEEKYGL